MNKSIHAAGEAQGYFVAASVDPQALPANPATLQAIQLVTTIGLIIDNISDISFESSKIERATNE